MRRQLDVHQPNHRRHRPRVAPPRERFPGGSASRRPRGAARTFDARATGSRECGFAIHAVVRTSFGSAHVEQQNIVTVSAKMTYSGLNTYYGDVRRRQ